MLILTLSFRPICLIFKNLNPEIFEVNDTLQHLICLIILRKVILEVLRKVLVELINLLVCKLDGQCCMDIAFSQSNILLKNCLVLVLIFFLLCEYLTVLLKEVPLVRDESRVQCKLAELTVNLLV